MEYQRVSVKLEKPILEVVDTLRGDAPRSDFINHFLDGYIQSNKDLLLFTDEERTQLTIFKVKRRFQLTDDEILAVGVILTRFLEYTGNNDGMATDAQTVLDKLGKDITRIYRNQAKRAKVDIQNIRR